MRPVCCPLGHGWGVVRFCRAAKRKKIKTESRIIVATSYSNDKGSAVLRFGERERIEKSRRRRSARAAP
jgi:hypothetical protein